MQLLNMVALVVTTLPRQDHPCNGDGGTYRWKPARVVGKSSGSMDGYVIKLGEGKG